MSRAERAGRAQKRTIPIVLPLGGARAAAAARSVRSIPKNIRLNCNVFFVGKLTSKKCWQIYMRKVSNVLTLEEFEKLYDKAMEEQFCSLKIDCSYKDKQFLRWLDT